MPRQPATTDIKGRLVFLGTGTSMGVPIIGCDCRTCISTDSRNHRLRCGLAVGLPEGNLLVDTPPELRLALVRLKVGIAHAVLYTHAHADHLFGLDDVRLFPHYLGRDLPVYCEAAVEERIRRTFDYAFDEVSRAYPAGGVPRVTFERIGLEPFHLLGARVVPLRLMHGRFSVLGFRFGNVAYCTDVSFIPDETWPRLAGLDVLILDCLRHEPHPTHFSLEEAVEAARRVGARRTLFTHMSHDLEHEATNSLLPPGMELAHDGLSIAIT